MAGLEKNWTWVVVSLSKGNNPVGYRWVYTVKYKSDGSLDRFRAQLVAKGYTQVYGVDYLDTFALVTKLNTFHVLLSLAANLGWQLHQYDVKNAFLYGDLEEEVYMDLSPNYDSPNQEKVVCKFNKALYGLKQSP